jgi:hypothetical protein
MRVVIFGSILTGIVFTGCGSISGMVNNTAPSGYHTEVVYDTKKVNIALNNIRKREIKNPIGKPISEKKVLYFREASIPKECIPIGYIAVERKDGFQSERNKFGFQKNIIPPYIKAVKKKASQLGVEAVNDFLTGMSGGDITILNINTNNPYIKKEYIKYKYTVIGQISEWDKCDRENECKKNKNYELCVRNCFKNRSPKSTKLFYYAVTAMKCDPKYLEKLREGENIDALNVKDKFKSFFK